MSTAEPPSASASTSAPQEHQGDHGDKDNTIYKVLFYVPPSHTQPCLNALWSTGAGTWPNGPSREQTASADPKYTDTCFISSGTGQFKPGPSAQPHIGTVGVVEYVQEDRVEMVVVGTERAKRAVAALRDAHPYEVVALFVSRCEDF